MGWLVSFTYYLVDVSAQLFNVCYLLFFICFYLLLLFSISEETFLKAILAICIILVMGVFISFVGGDFFAGFLLAAELPIMLVGLLFFFQKYDLQFEIHIKQNFNLFFLFFCVVFYLLTFEKNNLDSLIIYSNYSFFITFFNFSNRNDFTVYYSFYYVLWPIFVLFLGIFIFVVSYLVIIFFFNLQILSRDSKVASKQIMFLRHQNFFKQAVFNSKLRFFKESFPGGLPEGFFFCDLEEVLREQKIK